MMKILRAVCVLFGAAILVLGASAGQASAGGMYCWDSCGACESSGAYGYSGRGLSAAGGGGCWYGGDYDRYVIGHGPMFPAGDFLTGYSYGAPTGSNTSTAPNTPAAPNTSAGPNMSAGPSRP